MAKKGNKSGQWVGRHLKDPYVKKATSQGFRSRAVFKLEEIVKQDRLIRPDMQIVDLGAAPGSWSQWIMRQFSDKVTLVAVDLLAMDDIAGVKFIQGDFQDISVVEDIQASLNNRPIDLVISDMAPNITGIRSVDEAQYESLLDSLLLFCDQHLAPGGDVLAKLFEGAAAHGYRRAVKNRFTKGIVRKPAASRSKSREYYFLSRNKI